MSIHFHSREDKDKALSVIANEIIALRNKPDDEKRVRIKAKIQSFAEKIATDAVFDSHSPSSPKNGW